MNIVFESFSCVGDKQPNEDSVVAEVLPSGIGVFAIADGMGGERGGDVASRIAVSTAVRLIRETPSILFADVFKHVHQQLILEREKDNDLAKMGTTLTLCKIEESRVIVGHVGDTRLYHLRGQGLRTLTKDQTELQILIEEGVISKQRAKTYPRRHVLISVLSPSSTYELEEGIYELTRGDRLVLVTDGIYNVMTKTEIKNISLQSQDVSALCNTLRCQIELRKHKDDFSAIGIEYC